MDGMQHGHSGSSTGFRPLMWVCERRELRSYQSQKQHTVVVGKALKVCLPVQTAGQFKGKHAFLSHVLTEDTLGLQCVHNFRASGHGKCEVDGAATLVKNASRIENLKHDGKRFNGAASWYDYLQDNHRHVKPSTFAQRGTRISLAERCYHLLRVVPRPAGALKPRTLPGTRKCHCFLFGRPAGPAGQVMVGMRRLSCFCAACRAGNHTACSNLQYVGGINDAVLVPASRIRQPRAQQPHEMPEYSDDDDGSLASDDDSGSLADDCSLSEDDNGSLADASASPIIDPGPAFLQSVSTAIRVGRNTKPSAHDYSCNVVVSIVPGRFYPDEAACEYHLLRVITAPHVLNKSVTDGWGNTFSPGVKVVEGYYFELKEVDGEPLTHAHGMYTYSNSRDSPLAIVELDAITRVGFNMEVLGGDEYMLPEPNHLAALASVDVLHSGINTTE